MVKRNSRRDRPGPGTPAYVVKGKPLNRPATPKEVAKQRRQSGSSKATKWRRGKGFIETIQQEKAAEARGKLVEGARTGGVEVTEGDKVRVVTDPAEILKIDTEIKEQQAQPEKLQPDEDVRVSYTYRSDEGSFKISEGFAKKAREVGLGERVEQKIITRPLSEQKGTYYMETEAGAFQVSAGFAEALKGAEPEFKKEEQRYQQEQYWKKIDVAKLKEEQWRRVGEEREKQYIQELGPFVGFMAKGKESLEKFRESQKEKTYWRFEKVGLSRENPIPQLYTGLADSPYHYVNLWGDLITGASIGVKYAAVPAGKSILEKGPQLIPEIEKPPLSLGARTRGKEITTKGIYAGLELEAYTIGGMVLNPAIKWASPIKVSATGIHAQVIKGGSIAIGSATSGYFRAEAEKTTAEQRGEEPPPYFESFGRGAGSYLVHRGLERGSEVASQKIKTGAINTYRRIHWGGYERSFTKRTVDPTWTYPKVEKGNIIIKVKDGVVPKQTAPQTTLYGGRISDIDVKRATAVVDAGTIVPPKYSGTSFSESIRTNPLKPLSTGWERTGQETLAKNIIRGSPRPYAQPAGTIELKTGTYEIVGEIRPAPTYDIMPKDFTRMGRQVFIRDFKQGGYTWADQWKLGPTLSPKYKQLGPTFTILPKPYEQRTIPGSGSKLMQNFYTSNVKYVGSGQGPIKYDSGGDIASQFQKGETIQVQKVEAIKGRRVTNLPFMPETKSEASYAMQGTAAGAAAKGTPYTEAGGQLAGPETKTTPIIKTTYKTGAVLFPAVRTELKRVTKSELGTRNLGGFTPFPSLGQVYKGRTKQEQEEENLSDIRIGTIGATFTETATRTDQKAQTEQIQTPIVGVVPLPGTIPGTRPPPSVRVRERPPRPIPVEIPGWDFQRRERPGKPVQGYNVSVKEGGRWMRINERLLPRSEALRLGGDVVDNSASASFRVRGGKTKVPNSRRAKYATGINFNAIKFTRKKTNIYVEKRQFRIDTPGERAGITAKGLLAQRRRRQSPFL